MEFRTSIIVGHVLPGIELMEEALYRYTFFRSVEHHHRYCIRARGGVLQETLSRDA